MSGKPCAECDRLWSEHSQVSEKAFRLQARLHRIVVDDLGATVDFFRELGLELEGRAMIEGEWAGRVTGLGD